MRVLMLRVIPALILFGELLCTAPALDVNADPVKDEPPITDAQREFWSFRPLVRPTPPAILNTQIARNAIDQFTQARLEAKGKTLGPSASPETLIRRVTYDLTGLPPTPEEVQSFAKAARAYEASNGKIGPDPYEQLVDRLLASPRHGEKWAQTWLDLARFAESDGFELDAERKEAWKYRNWVVEALNADMPLNEFVALQIAADEISPQHAAATGFLMAGPDMPDSNFPDERRHLLLNDMTTTVGSAFLGLTIGCAQCHNHPFDPISQADFYRLRAFFDNMILLKKDQQMPPSMIESGKTPAPSFIAIRGDHQRRGPKVIPSFPRIGDYGDESLAFASLPKSSGRRMALARWVTQPDNRLFLRANANRLWQAHFIDALAATPNDLGHQGAFPTNLELLDWLACEISERKWSMKTMHKLIVTSTTYRQAGGNERASQESKSHFPRRRLTGEELRDAMLFVAGRMKFDHQGPSLRATLPLAQPQADQKTSAKSKTKNPVTEPEPDCRTIWLFTKRNQLHPMLDLFDRPDGLLSCSRRNESTTAPQSLYLFNSNFSHGIAKSLASELLEQTDNPGEIVNLAVWRCFSRPPSELEISLGAKFFANHHKLTDDFRVSVADFCLALFNSNAFCYID